MSGIFSLSPLHEHADPTQRVLGLAKLPPDSKQIAQLLAADPAAEVRAAAAARCEDGAALAAALRAEAEPAVRAEIAQALARALAVMQDAVAAQALLAAEECTDAIRIDVASRALDPGMRHMAIECIREEDALIELALTGARADARKEAAGRVQTLAGLKALAEAAQEKDRGVATLARARVREINRRAARQAEADAVLVQLEAVAAESGPILTAVVNLSHRWKELEPDQDAARAARFDAIWQTIQVRFDREQQEQRARTRFEQRANDSLVALAGAALPTRDELARLHEELDALRVEAQQRGIVALVSRLDEAQERIARWGSERAALDVAEALLAEAEQRVASSAEGSGDLEARWQAVDRAARLPALSRRFEVAMQALAQRRIARADAARQEERTRRQRLHELLHAAEQALPEGQLQAARSAVDEMKALRTLAGILPKPTLQRLNLVTQRLAELERWEKFGQQHARLQLCDRAEALPAQSLDVTRLAVEVRKLRDEWKALDKQHPGCPKSLWERFDRACETAYAPAAAHFAQQAALKKEARQRRKEFVAEVAARASAAVGESPDWRELGNWLRTTEQTWREGKLGSVDPADWKALDKKLQAAMAPVRQALAAARSQARLGRQALIEEVAALAPKALERDTPSRVKAIQARWQEQAKSLPLEQRDERALWEKFRAACNAVFEARDTTRKEEDVRRQEMRRALEGICAQLEGLSRDTETEEPAIRRSVREMQEQWKAQLPELPRGDPSLRELENRFNRARSAAEGALSSRAVSKTAAEWKSLADKERICRELDHSLVAGADPSSPLSADALHTLNKWAELAPLPARWEQALTARRDAALQALADSGAAAAYMARLQDKAGARRMWLVEIELALELPTPPELQEDRRALQVRQLRERFKRDAGAPPESPGEMLFKWCAQPGGTGALDQQRLDRIFARAAQGTVRL